MPDHDPAVRKAAISLLSRGLVRPHEAAELAGVSLQVMNYWIARAGIDWERIRRAQLVKLWQRQSFPSRRI